MRGHSLVELTEHDDIAANIIVHSFWTTSSLDVPAGVTKEEGHTGFLIHLLSAVRALIFLARRIQPFLSLVDREVDFLCNVALFHVVPTSFFATFRFVLLRVT